MNLVFISNNNNIDCNIDGHSMETEKQICIYNKVLTYNDKAKELCFNNERITIDTSGNTVYIIDVHSIFNYNENNLKPTDQGGVIIYRYLLKMYEGENRQNNYHDKLKVIFYSPVPVKLLTEQNPENYILNLLPFLWCRYDGTFVNELNTISLRNKFPSYNNASENLLSGWAAIESKRINEKIFNGKSISKILSWIKPLFIDDEINHWENVYKEIFNHNCLCIKYNYEIEDFMALSQDDISEHWFYKKINSCTFIISDFYLNESHNKEIWKGRDYYETISGYRLYTKVRQSFPFIPYMLFTTSNKIYNYELFDDWGIDKYVVKDNRHNASKEEKEENYMQFEIAINNLNSLTWINKQWKNFSKLYSLKAKAELNEVADKYWWFDEVKVNLESSLNYDFTDKSENMLASQFAYCINGYLANYDERFNKILKKIIYNDIIEGVCQIFIFFKRQYRRSIYFETSINKENVWIIDPSKEYDNLHKYSFNAVILLLFNILELIIRIDRFHPLKDKEIIKKHILTYYSNPINKESTDEEILNHLNTHKNTMSFKRKNKDIKDENELGYNLYLIRNKIAHSNNPLTANWNLTKDYLDAVIMLLISKNINGNHTLKNLANKFKIDYPDFFKNK